jgi:ubiquinone/menaquinone biosynthesis C-methylase UbiE
MKNDGSVCAIFNRILFIAAFIICIAPASGFGQVDRETWQPPEKIMDAIGVKPGMRIGEAGAGRGYFTFPLARRVGSSGVVLANDISVRSLDVIQERAQREKLENIKIVAGQPEDPLFPEKNLDMVVMVYVLHEVESPVPFLNNIRKYLKPEGLLVIIERITDLESTHIPQFMTKERIIEKARESGYELKKIEGFLPYDGIYIFTKVKQ